MLYAAYRRYIASVPFREPFATTLNPQQFGIALGRVFSLKESGILANEEQHRHPNRVRRTWHGKAVWGYLGFVGPETVMTASAPGRPQKHD